MAALDLSGRRWCLRVLWVRVLWELRDGPVGFRELQQRCDGMSSSVLRDRLRDLGDASLVVTGDKGGYSLTALGDELGVALGPLQDWSARWAEQLAR